jgi:hypothetical protein
MAYYKTSGGGTGDVKKGKIVKNLTGTTLHAFKAVAWLNDGSVALASAATSTITDFVGVLEANIATGSTGLAVRIGPIPGALAGKGAVPGQYVYLDTAAGELTLDAPDANSTNAIIKVGKAEPAGTLADGSAPDLFVEIGLISE